MLEKIKEAIVPLIEAQDCYLDDLVYEQEKGEWYLRVYIEKNNGSLDMDTCVAVSEAVSEKLDQIDVIKDEYYLEVSSPGIEKPLRNWDQVVKAVNDYVHIDFKDPKEGLHEVEGTILSAEDQTITLQYFVKGRKKKIVVPYDNVRFIRLAVKF
ncbi:MAG: ribosome maturation factor RimP [Intestinibaculum porci]|uniref:ribosome maturation factor RimP n=1 Tax=Intestinibaculum porci TaxID=2487118 RepID=UPI002409B2D6|nr:ribosome maturation factor RimP [Intestinibaculum porci]MDD6423303.1 ribosome maturation factor RimP [Intestinibaculum porci]